MHYIRFLKSPKLVGSGDSKALVAKITITTDLGESFLATDLEISVEIAGAHGEGVKAPGSEYVWKGSEGMRSLEVRAEIGTVKWRTVRMCVSATDDDEFFVNSFEGVLGFEFDSGQMTRKEENPGSVVMVRGMEIDVHTGQSMGSGMAERVFTSAHGNNSEIHIWEETGESIARHVWDAGLVLSAYIACLPQLPPTKPSTLARLSLLEKALKQPNLKILELGAGCGIVGITLAYSISSLQQLLLTDLPEATDILTRNLSPNVFQILSTPTSTISHQVLDWSAELPGNVAATKWDMVLVADCTYNPDVLPHLVHTLGSVAQGNGEVGVWVAMKVRHQSEVVFFELMREEGFEVSERAVFELPVRGGEGEEIEVYGFEFVRDKESKEFYGRG